MRILRGFHIKKHLLSIITRPCRRRKNRYLRLDSSDPEETRASRSASKSRRWCEWVKHKAMRLCSAPTAWNYKRVDDEREKEGPVPKGFLAVYVGRDSGDESRVLVPIIYFNHPLFGELLREAEDEFGYEHRGGIKLPCPLSELEKVQTRIASSGCCGGRSMMRMLL